MGAYLSEPVVDKLSNDENSEELKLSYGASCMQGWRVSQEDAHNCILNYDKDTSFFSVYDGHGGHEVATYCALHLPDFLKNTQAYKDGNISQALEDAYLEFDHHLTKLEVIKELKLIAGTTDKKEENQSDEDPDEMSNLYEEATMSIEELIMRYGHAKYKGTDESAGGCGSSSKGSAAEHIMSKLCARAKKEKQKLAKTNLMHEEGAEEIDHIKGCPKKLEEAHQFGTEEMEEDCVTEADGSRPSKIPSAKSEIKSEQKEASTASSLSPQIEDSTKDSTEDEKDKKEAKDSNGSLQNGSSHVADAINEEKVVVSSKGKGVGKGLSNSIRKVVEKTREELERERIEAERLTKRMERKQSLRKKSGDELYRAMVTNEEDEDETDEDGDDEEDADFEGDGSSTSEEEAHGNDDEEDEDEDDGDEEEDEEEAEEEEDSEEVKATSNEFSMNMKEEPGSDSGCTAVVAVLNGNQLFVANAGDSRCVLSREGRAIPLSADHKPEDDAEKSRIEHAGGVVTADGRVNGGLNLSRAIGDHAYKQNTNLGPKEQMITALPDIQMVNLEAGDEFFVLACDGIWNSKSNQQVVDFVRPRLLTKKQTLSQICEELFDECLAPNTMGDGTGCDNMTAMIVRLDRFLPRFQDLNPAVRETSVSTTAGSSHPVKRPLNHDNANDENGDSISDLTGADEDRMKEKRQRVDDDVGDVAAKAETSTNQI